MRLGFGEILVILALALLLFGPSKLPQLGSSLGEAIKGLGALHDEIDVDPSVQEQPKGLPADIAGPTTIEAARGAAAGAAQGRKS
jgi:sec-independent protein translocase protein TatA